MTPSPHKSSVVDHTTQYQPHIDGIRAIAVLAVVLFHVGMPSFSGGFVGVDVFLVISGYLISGILLREYDRTGTVSLRSFYYRRLRRIAPALIVTVFLTSIPLLWLYSPVLLAPYGRSVWMAMASISNIGFYQTSGYFDATAETKPLLHTWSLSVEEQFYFVWPILLLAVMRLRRYRFILIFAISVVSVAAAQYMLQNDPEAAFFMMPFRIVEFAIGALLHAPLITNARVSPRLRHVTALLGFAAVGVSIYVYTEATPFPGINALLPCLGTAALLWCGQTSIARHVLSAKPMVWVGKLSYALYLVHWPLFLLYERYRMIFLYEDTPLTFATQLILIFVAFCVAILLHTVVEVPFRIGKVVPRTFVYIVAGAMILTATAGWYVEAHKGLPGRASLPDSSFMAKSYPHWLRDRIQSHPNECLQNRKYQCKLPTTNQKKILIIGNSHALDGVNIIAAARPNDYLYVIETNDCAAPPAPANPRCQDPKHLHDSPAFLRTFDVVIVSRRLHPNAVSENQRNIQFLKEAGVKRAIVFSNYLQTFVSFDDALQMHGKNLSVLQHFVVRTEDVDRDIGDTTRAQGYLFLDKYAAVCTAAGCPLFTPAGVPFTYDKHHLTRAFATYIGQQAAAEINAYINAP